MAKFKDAPKFLLERLSNSIEPETRARAIKFARTLSVLNVSETGIVTKNGTVTKKIELGKSKKTQSILNGAKPSKIEFPSARKSTTKKSRKTTR